jgi:hypothetical protein
MRRKRLYVSGIGAIVAGLFAVIGVPSASAGGGFMVPDVKKVDCGEVSVDAGPVLCATITYTDTLPPDHGLLGPDEIFAITSSDEFPTAGHGGGPPCGEDQPVPGSCQLDVFFDPAETGKRKAELLVIDGLSFDASPVKLVGHGIP